ncbi:hypothetical protein DFH94DRAFT_797993 [Russula ochroleuca]|uniref:Uncharacterized protein n=1 Tax=Russula ochroleuca TaxID=152965 RepID=A0A9P5TF35_9AGAM|nr:hypothetical protein DFH94DRAFT_797993 [Russula ochroleuca]
MRATRTVPPDKQKVDTIGECWPIFNELTYFIKNSRPLKLIWDDVREYKLHTSIHESPCLECLELESEFQSLDGMRTQTDSPNLKIEIQPTIMTVMQSAEDFWSRPCNKFSLTIQPGGGLRSCNSPDTARDYENNKASEDSEDAGVQGMAVLVDRVKQATAARYARPWGTRGGHEDPAALSPARVQLGAVQFMHPERARVNVRVFSQVECRRASPPHALRKSRRVGQGLHLRNQGALEEDFVEFWYVGGWLCCWLDCPEDCE